MSAISHWKEWRPPNASKRHGLLKDASAAS
jgi:hypothetical protein